MGVGAQTSCSCEPNKAMAEHMGRMGCVAECLWMCNVGQLAGARMVHVSVTMR